MLNRSISSFLVLLMISFGSLHMAAAPADKGISKKESKVAKRAAEIKAGVEKLGAGVDSKVQVKLRDKTKIKGYIGDIGDKGFTVIDKAGESHMIEYANAKQIKGNNLHAGVWVAVGVGIAIVVVLIVLKATLD